MSSFCKAMTKTFIGATLGAVTSFVAERGIKGAQGKADFVDLALTGMHVGVNFISYPIALKLLSEAIPEFKKNMQNPNGCKAITYIAGGLTGALLGTLAKYPLIKIAEIRKNGKTKCSGCEIVSNWVNSAGGAIGSLPQTAQFPHSSHQPRTASLTGLVATSSFTFPILVLHSCHSQLLASAMALTSAPCSRAGLRAVSAPQLSVMPHHTSRTSFASLTKLAYSIFCDKYPNISF